MDEMCLSFIKDHGTNFGIFAQKIFCSWLVFMAVIFALGNNSLLFSVIFQSFSRNAKITLLKGWNRSF